LFLRYEARFIDASGAAMEPVQFPPMIHMGGNLFEPLAPRVRVEGPFSLPATGSLGKTMQVVMDEVFKGALADIDLTGFLGSPEEEVRRGERLRRSMPQLKAFRLAP
jgi:hypothetical protein